MIIDSTTRYKTVVKAFPEPTPLYFHSFFALARLLRKHSAICNARVKVNGILFFMPKAPWFLLVCVYRTGNILIEKYKLKTRVRLSALHARACVICAPKCNMRAGVHKAGNKCKQLQLFNNFFEQERE